LKKYNWVRKLKLISLALLLLLVLSAGITYFFVSKNIAQQQEKESFDDMIVRIKAMAQKEREAHDQG
jgi:flagellar basal body-associated protein FliL